MKIEQNFITLEVKSFDDTKGQVTFYFGAWNEDRDKDTLETKSMDETLKENKENIYWNLDHEEVCGVIDPSSFGTDSNGPYCTGQLLIGDGGEDKGTEMGHKAYSLYKAKAIKGHSMEYVTKKSKPDGKGGRILQKIDLWGVTSMTKIPANQKATTISVKSFLGGVSVSLDNIESIDVENISKEEKDLIEKLYKKVCAKPIEKKNFISASILKDTTIALNKKSFISIDTLEEIIEFKATFTEAQRKKYAKQGIALPDGSFPIRNATDLENAIHDVGRATDPASAKAHIKKRAAALGLTDKLPDKWDTKDSSLKVEYKKGNKYIRMRDNEQAKDGARVVAGGDSGKVVGREASDRFNYSTSQMEAHDTLKVEHPAGTRTYDGGVSITPDKPFTKFYDSRDLMVHEDDIEKKPKS